ncbi:MAG: DNA/RNA non-specific endonuclease [Spirochaetia bacterium]|nr:DNA/RNA non-specific endonuclease [Spirochaetia bacterium]
MKKTVIVFLLLTAALAAPAYSPNDNENVRFGFPSKNGVMLYKNGFTLLYSTYKKNPVWVSYHLTPDYVKKPLKPKYSFGPDPRLKKGERAELADYAGSPYVRGRMACLKDMSRVNDVMKEACYLTNVCPMNDELYRGAWQKLEDSVRRFVMKGKDVWVVTGPVYAAPDRDIKKIGAGKVYVPTHFYKVVLYQGGDYSFKAAGFVFLNKKQSGPLWEYARPIAEIEEMTGLRFFSLLPPEVQTLIKEKKATPSQLAAMGI